MTIVKEYIDIPLEELDPDEVIESVAKYGAVMIRRHGSTPARFAEWAKQIFYVLSPKIWCSDTEHSEYYWRVTNKIVDGENPGLVSTEELDWHVNITPVIDAEEVVALYAKTITYPTETWICNSQTYWETLDPYFQRRFEDLTVVLDPTKTKGPIKPGWTPRWEKIYTEKIFKDIYKNRQTRKIQNADNIDPADAKLYPESRGIIDEVRMVPKHPLGTKCLFFTPYEVHAFKDKNGIVVPDSEQIFYMLWNDWIESGKYTYKLQWQEDDILIMDQLSGIHRRPQVDHDKDRELLRLPGWYKTKHRKHTGYSL